MRTKISLLSLTFLSPLALFAQAAEGGQTGEVSPYVMMIIYVVIAMMLLVTLFLWRISVHLRKYMRGEFESEEQKMYDNRSTWEKIFQIKPTGTDRDVMLDHDYDGIKELDNPPPPWFMFLFYGTIVIAVIYFIRFSITGSGPTQAEEYAAEMDAAQAQVAAVVEEKSDVIDENTVVLLKTEEDLAAGNKIYITNCKICHAEGGMGSIGPNLTDQYWKNGGGIKNIFKTIKYGVPEKGMISWESTFTPQQIQQVASFIISLEGTNPPGGKDPEGELWVPEESAEVVPEADSIATESPVVE